MAASRAGASTTRSRKAQQPAAPDAAPARRQRSVWKGAISFGLVNIPVGLHAATRSSGIDFDWLDRRTMDPVGYQRVNKKTGRQVAPEDIVRAVEYEDDRYVVLTEEEIEHAYPRTTQTIELEAFVDADEIPFVYLERPYYLAPLAHGEKAYALLREALRQSNRVAVARVVIHTKQHLAVLMPCGRAIVLNLLRWGGEVRASDELNLPPASAKAAGLRDSEMKMALELIDGMTQAWHADQFRNAFAEEIRKLVETKAREGDVQVLEEAPAPADEASASNVVDLMRLLRRSLQGQKPAAASGTPTRAGKGKAATPRAKAAPVAAKRRKAPARKAPTAARKAA